MDLKNLEQSLIIIKCSLNVAINIICPMKHKRKFVLGEASSKILASDPEMDYEGIGSLPASAATMCIVGDYENQSCCSHLVTVQRPRELARHQPESQTPTPQICTEDHVPPNFLFN